MNYFEGKSIEEADVMYSQLLENWKSEVVENAQLLKQYDNVMLDFLSISTAYAKVRRRVVEEHEGVDKYGFPQLADG
jgi:hypothetical protein